jgi:hypothetical protein
LTRVASIHIPNDRFFLPVTQQSADGTWLVMGCARGTCQLDDSPQRPDRPTLSAADRANRLDRSQIANSEQERAGMPTLARHVQMDDQVFRALTSCQQAR